MGRLFISFFAFYEILSATISGQREAWVCISDSRKPDAAFCAVQNQ